MDPDANQPGPDRQLPNGPSAPPTPPHGQPTQPPAVPEWQQGLGRAPAPTPGVGVPPATPASAMPPMDVTPPLSIPPSHGTAAGGGPFKKMPFGVLLVVATLAIILFVVTSYFWIFKSNKTNNTASNAANASSSSASKSAIAMSELTNVKLNAPRDMSDFGADTPDGNLHVYLTKASTGDNACSFEFGTATSMQLPGANINAIINPQVTFLENAGAAVDGPMSAGALVLKDAGDSSITYSMPTLMYSFTQGTKHATSYYSLVILKNGDRALVSRQCANANGSIDQAQLNALEAMAQKITVNKL